MLFGVTKGQRSGTSVCSLLRQAQPNRELIWSLVFELCQWAEWRKRADPALKSEPSGFIPIAAISSASPPQRAHAVHSN